MVGGLDNNIRGNVWKGLDILKQANYQLESSIFLLNIARNSISRRARESNNIAGQKWPSSCTGTSLPPNKWWQLHSSTSTESGIRTFNQIHWRMVLSDYGKPIYKASSRVAMLNGLIDCIKGFKSLYTKADILQGDISMNNLIINKDDLNPSWSSFIIDLDLAINEQCEKRSGAQEKTGTRAFMSIEVLWSEQHSFMYKLESFF